MDHGQTGQSASGRNFALGAAAALAAALIWGSWIVVTRLGVTTTLAPADAAFLRFGIPAVVLLPVLLREGLALRRIGVVRTLLMVAGVLAIGGYHLLLGESGQWRGHLLFLCGACLWAVYTLAFRRAGIGPWHAAALINAWSIVAFLPIYLWTGSRLPQASWAELGLQGLSQGVLSGIVALLAYGVAVRRLGGPRAAVFISLTPAIAAVIAIPVLGEWPDAATIFGIGAVTLGVALASGALGQGVGIEVRGIAQRLQSRWT